VPDRLAWSLALAAVAAILMALPHLLSFSQREIAVFLLINVLLVSSYRLLTLAGEWSLGHVVIMGVGGYASALYAKLAGVPVPLAMLLGAGTSGAVAYVLSFPLFRMKGFYFLIGSFAAGEVIRLLWIKFRIFGGPKGLKLIPPFPDLGPIAFFDPTSYYYLCLAVVGVSLTLLYRIEHSRIGLTFHAVHWRDQLAESVGVDTRRYRTLAFVLASFFAGISGALLAHYIGTVNPNRFDVAQMVFVLIWVIVGGTATFFGPIIGVVTLTIVNEIVLRQLGTDELRPLFYGAILIAAMLFLPGGLESLGPKLAHLFGRNGAKRVVEQGSAAKAGGYEPS
jgi:branched-chain amino acid transport system permease protein